LSAGRLGLRGRPHSTAAARARRLQERLEHLLTTQKPTRPESCAGSVADASTRPVRLALDPRWFLSRVRCSWETHQISNRDVTPAECASSTAASPCSSKISFWSSTYHSGVSQTGFRLALPEIESSDSTGTGLRRFEYGPPVQATRSELAIPR
jgi:hypothetical protein